MTVVVVHRQNVVRHPEFPAVTGCPATAVLRKWTTIFRQSIRQHGGTDAAAQQNQSHEQIGNHRNVLETIPMFLQDVVDSRERIEQSPASAAASATTAATS